jgi:LPXTG-site transpeptidase (sortase) family protein
MENNPVLRKRRRRRRMPRPLRRLARLSKLRAAIALAMVVAAVGGAAALVLLLNGSRGPAPASAIDVPLALGPHGLHVVSPAATPQVPLTVRIVVPAARIDLQAVQGDGVSVPMQLAMHYPGTDQPGGGSNALYYAHAQPGMFQGLYQMHKGDVIRAVRADGTTVDYHAAAFEYVPYDDLSVLKPTPYDEITLLTCTSYDPHTPRYIVIGLPGDDG